MERKKERTEEDHLLGKEKAGQTSASPFQKKEGES